MSSSPTDELSRKLRAWRVEPQVPAGFQREVWQRIAAQRVTGENAFWPSLPGWLAAQFTRPRHAVALAAVMLLAGLGLGQARAQELNVKNRKTLEARYADSVNPLAMAR